MITLEAVDQVIERTGVSYKEAKEYLEKTNGDALEAIIMIQEENTRAKTEAEAGCGQKIDAKGQEIIDKIKEMIAEGNVNKIVIKRNEETLVTIPVNVGIVGGIVGLAAAPVTMLVAAVAAYGFDCRFEILKNDGTTVTLGDMIKKGDKKDDDNGSDGGDGIL